MWLLACKVDRHRLLARGMLQINQASYHSWASKEKINHSIFVFQQSVLLLYLYVAHWAGRLTPVTANAVRIPGRDLKFTIEEHRYGYFYTPC